MAQEMTRVEAAAALGQIDRVRSQVIDEIDIPNWYWIGLAAGWMTLGVISDLHRPLLAMGATLVFGAAHAGVYHQVAGGRQHTSGVRISAELAGRHVPLIVWLCLLGLAGGTVIGALAASADGSRHPATAASIAAAITILLGGPRLMRAVRNRARRTLHRPAS